MFPSLFTKKIQDKTKESVSNNPPSLCGELVATKDVVRSELSNPWFLSFNSMSPQDTQNMLDNVKTGLSLVAPDTSGLKGGRTFINPKFVDHMSSSGVGKFSDISSVTPGEIWMGDTVQTGSHYSTPTLIGMARRRVSISPNQTITTNAQQVTNNVVGAGAPVTADSRLGGTLPAKPTSPPPTYNGVTPPGQNSSQGELKPLNPFDIPGGGIEKTKKLTHLVDPDGKAIAVKLNEGENWLGGNVQTGTALLDVGMLHRIATMSSYGIPRLGGLIG